MERLTEYTDSSPAINTRKLQFHCDVGGYIIGDIARRLAAYEDICFGEDGKERITIEELSALVKARDEGRVVVLPMKTVFEPVWDAGNKCDLKCPERFDGLDTCQGCSKAVPHAYQRDCRPDDVIGKNVFPNRAEAEAALGGGGDG